MVESLSPVCPMCGGAVASVARECPQCGEPQPGVARTIPRIDSSLEHGLRPARPHDYVLLGLLSVAGGVITVPPTWMAMNEVLSYTLAEPSLLVLVALWNTWVWALPIFWAVSHWRQGALAGIEDHSYLARVFWQCQAVTVGLPLSLLLLLLSICALG